MGLFNKNKKNKQNKKLADTNISQDGNIASVNEYQGPNILGAISDPSIFVYGHPINVKVTDDDPSKVQAGLFAKNIDGLAQVYSNDILANLNTTADGLPIRITIETPNADTAQALVTQLLTTHNLMLALSGVASTRINRQGMQQIELVVPFGSFIIINAANDGHAEITTTKIELDDNKPSEVEPQMVNKPDTRPEMSSSFDEDTEPQVNEYTDNNVLDDSTDTDSYEQNRSSAPDTNDDFKNQFNDRLNDL